MDKYVTFEAIEVVAGRTDYTFTLVDLGQNYILQFVTSTASQFLVNVE